MEGIVVLASSELPFMKQYKYLVQHPSNDISIIIFPCAVKVNMFYNFDFKKENFIPRNWWMQGESVVYYTSFILTFSYSLAQ